MVKTYDYEALAPRAVQALRTEFPQDTVEPEPGYGGRVRLARSGRTGPWVRRRRSGGERRRGALSDRSARGRGWLSSQEGRVPLHRGRVPGVLPQWQGLAPARCGGLSGALA